MDKVTIEISREDALTLRCLLIGSVIDAKEHMKTAETAEDRGFFKEDMDSAVRLRQLIVDAMRDTDTAIDIPAEV